MDESLYQIGATSGAFYLYVAAICFMIFICLLLTVFFTCDIHYLCMLFISIYKIQTESQTFKN